MKLDVNIVVKKIFNQHPGELVVLASCCQAMQEAETLKSYSMIFIIKCTLVLVSMEARNPPVPCSPCQASDLDHCLVYIYKKISVQLKRCQQNLRTHRFPLSKKPGQH